MLQTVTGKDTCVAGCWVCWAVSDMAVAVLCNGVSSGAMLFFSTEGRVDAATAVGGLRV